MSQFGNDRNYWYQLVVVPVRSFFVLIADVVDFPADLHEHLPQFLVPQLIADNQIQQFGLIYACPVRLNQSNSLLVFLHQQSLANQLKYRQADAIQGDFFLVAQ